MSKFAIKNHWIEVVLVVLLVGVTILRTCLESFQEYSQEG
ncbi:hypothetical protein LBP_p5g018 (plasmid) [Lactiplantibacillus plantarum subsp. plantarum P-8]|nr:hypothetical protein LBP_p5g018 [Lactiplantibacillus plantarum subsp. plantarum P-8]